MSAIVERRPDPTGSQLLFAGLARAGPFIVFGLFVLATSRHFLPARARILSYADGPYFWPWGGFDFLSTWNASNLGLPFIAQSFTSFQFLPWKLSEPIFMAAGDGWHAYVLYYMPLYTACLAAFFLGRRVSGSAVYGYFAGFFLILNSFILEQLLVWPVSYLYCLTGFLLQVHVLWTIYEEGITPGRIGLAILSSFLVHHPFLFLISMSFQVPLLALIVVRRRARVRQAAAIVGGAVLMQSFWLVPFLYNLVASSVAETHRSSGESAFSGYITTISYRALFNQSNYPFNLGPEIWRNIHDLPQTLFNYALVALVVGLLMVAIRRKAERLTEIVFFFCLYLFFFNLALGPNSEITGALWMWSYGNVPGFAFLRSFNRFNLAALIALILMGALLFRALHVRWRAQATLALIAINIACYSIFFSTNFNGMLAMAHVPSAYYEANEKHFKVNRGAVLLSLPHVPYESYAWAINSRNDLTGQGIYFVSYFMNAAVILNGYGYNLEGQWPEYREVLQFHYLWRPLDETAHDRIRRLGVTHVMVHKDRIDTLLKRDKVLPWGAIRKEFADNPRYRMTEDNDVFSLFELKAPLGLVSGPAVEFEAVSQTEYRLWARNLRAPIEIKFAQSYNRGWNVYSGSAPPSPGKVAGGGMAKNRLEWRGLDRLFERPVLGRPAHHEVDGFANAWTLDPAELRGSLPAGSYKVNPDGSMDVGLVLYFRPQAFLLLGIALSLATMLACIALLVWRALRRLFASGRPRRTRGLEASP